jgi:hypothetical protein
MPVILPFPYGNRHTGAVLKHSGRFGCLIEVMSTTTATAPPVSPSERCDRCGARAVIRAMLPGGSDLVFCAHHGRQHAKELQAVAVAISDDEGVLQTP